MKKGKVYIVGVGPGNYRLMTLRALECIKKSDVIVHDRLIDAKVLSFASDNAEFINVGKQPELHQVPQKEICEILLKLAMEGKTVARVKGGDPFLFGRGGEECEFLQSHGVEFEVVPGITSAIAVPAYAGIPVTHRDHASSLHILTGHNSAENEGKGLDHATLSKLEGTIVFLMGVKHIGEICSGLIKYGKSIDTPAAIIENGASAMQRTLIGTLGDISEKSVKAGIKSPAVIVIGSVAKLGEKISWLGKGKLSGKKIVVTRAANQSEKLAIGLEEHGAQAIEFPVIKISEIEDYRPLEKALDNMHEYKWLVFTSTNAVDVFFKQIHKLKKDIRLLAGVKLAVVGTATEEALKEKGLYVDFIPEKFSSADLLEGLLKVVGKDEKVLLVKSEIARPELSEGLKKEGINVDEIIVYKLSDNNIDKSELLNLLHSNNIDFITFTSPSIVKAFVSIIGIDIVKELTSKFVCVGPITANELKELGIRTYEVAEKHNDDGLIDKLIELSEV